MLKQYEFLIKIIVMSAICIALIYLGHWLTNNHWQAKYSALETSYAKSQAEANAAIRAQEAMWQDKIDKVTQDAKKTQERLQADSEQLAATIDSLRSTAKVSASKLQSTNTTITELRRTNATTELVQRELLGYSLARVESLAAAYDRSRAEGLACVSAYNALR